MSLENQWLEDVFPTKIVPFWGDMLVFRGVFHGSIFLGKKEKVFGCSPPSRMPSHHPPAPGIPYAKTWHRILCETRVCETPGNPS